MLIFAIKNFVIVSGEPTPNVNNSKFSWKNYHQKNICDWIDNHQIQENILPWKFGAIKNLKCKLAQTLV